MITQCPQTDAFRRPWTVQQRSRRVVTELIALLLEELSTTLSIGYERQMRPVDSARRKANLVPKLPDDALTVCSVHAVHCHYGRWSSVDDAEHIRLWTTHLVRDQ